MENGTNPVIINDAERGLPVHSHQQPANFIEKAIESGSSVEALEKLMDLQERWEAKQAEKAFLQSFTNFQSICPILDRTRKISYEGRGNSGTVAYSFTPLDEMADKIKAPLKECGLSYRYEYEEKDGLITCSCILSHVDGHSKTSKMTAEADTTGSKNSIQSIGSTRSYLERYTLKSALALVSADEDNDGNDGISLIEASKELLDLLSAYPEHQRNYLMEIVKTIRTKNTLQKYTNELPTAEQTSQFKSLVPLVAEDQQNAIWDAWATQTKDSAKAFLTKMNQSFNKEKTNE